MPPKKQPATKKAPGGDNKKKKAAKAAPKKKASGKRAVSTAASRAQSPAPRRPSVPRASSVQQPVQQQQQQEAKTKITPKSPKMKPASKKQSAATTIAAAVKTIMNTSTNKKKSQSRARSQSRAAFVDPVERMRRSIMRDVMDWAVHLASKDTLAAICNTWEVPPAPAKVGARDDAEKTHIDLISCCTFSKVPAAFLEAFIARNWDYVNMFVSHSDWDLLIRLRPPSSYVVGLDYGDDELRRRNSELKLKRGAVKLGAALNPETSGSAKVAADQVKLFGDTQAKIDKWKAEMAAVKLRRK